MPVPGKVSKKVMKLGKKAKLPATVSMSEQEPKKRRVVRNPSLHPEKHSSQWF